MAGKSLKAQKWEAREKRRALFIRIASVLLTAVLLFSFTPTGRSFWNHLFYLSGFGGTSPAKAPFLIHVLDVGKADAIVLECEGSTALLDAGTVIKGDVVLDYLARHCIGSLDYAILSHPDKDHIGGMAQVLEEIPVDTFVQAELPEQLTPESDEFAALEEALAEGLASRKIVKPGDTFSLGGAELTVLGPLREYDDTNNASLVFRLTYGGFSALFCGDIEKEAEKDLVKSGADLSADLLKVPHHGSKTSCSERFLKAVSPQYAVIPVGADKNNLPREEALLRLEKAGAEIYRTDTDGTVVFSIDGENVSIKSEK